MLDQNILKKILSYFRMNKEMSWAIETFGKHFSERFLTTQKVFWEALEHLENIGDVKREISETTIRGHKTKELTFWKPHNRKNKRRVPPPEPDLDHKPQKAISASETITEVDRMDRKRAPMLVRSKDSGLYILRQQLTEVPKPKKSGEKKIREETRSARSLRKRTKIAHGSARARK